MPDLPFDPAKAITFDLAQGVVQLQGSTSSVLVPADALLVLAHAAGAPVATAFGRAVGEAMGHRVGQRLGAAEGVNVARVDVVVEHLSGEIALAGLGSVGVERWGRAVVLVVDHSPLGAQGDPLLAAIFAGAIDTATGRSVHVLPLGRDAARTRFFVGGSAGIEKVRAWLNDGISWGEALVRLHAPADARRGDA